MVIPLEYKLTTTILNLVSRIEAKKELFSTITIPPKVIANLKRQSLFKSSLFSAKIEGNRLDLSDISQLRKQDPGLKERIEVENILSALSLLEKSTKRDIDINFLTDVHKIVMNRLSEDLGIFRKEPTAIFNESGFAVYIPPPPSQIQSLIKQLVDYMNFFNDENPLIKASLSHVSFEKIHPFLDGNGRVGRLLLAAIIQRNGYDFKGLFPIEEILNERKEEYYAYLDRTDATSFIEFMLEVMLAQIEKTLDQVYQRELKPEDLLLPRRREILEIVRDHKATSVDFLKRRFNKVSPRMIRFDLKKLENDGYIIKLGTTRGAMYSPKEK
jgi:Fic family protein